MKTRRATRMTPRQRSAHERATPGACEHDPAAGQTPASPAAERTRGTRGWGVSRRTVFVILGLALLIFASYLPALRAGFVWDDAVFTREPVIREGVSGLAKIWVDPSAIRSEGHYWPLVYSSFWLEEKLWGLEPLGFHLVNLLLHLLCTLLVWRLLFRLRVPGAPFAAAIFAVHPLHVESVAWVIERKDLLSGAFFLGSLLLWLRFVREPRPKHYAGSLLLFVAALLSKSIAVTLPAALLVERFWKTGRIGRADWLRTAPFFAVGLAISLADLAYYRTREVVELGYSLLERGLIAARALWFYSGKLVWPDELAVIYPRWEIRTSDLVAWLFLLAALALFGVVWFGRHRFGRGPLAGLGFFAITLSPTLGFVDYGYMQFAFVADRFQYLAGIGVLALVVGAATEGVGKLARPFQRGTVAVFAAVVVFLATLSFRQTQIYRDPATFFGHIVSLNPHARDAYLNLTNALMDQGRHEEALAAARKSLETTANPANAHSNLGLALMNLRRFDEAETELRRARSLDPSHRNSLQNLSELLRRKKEYESAIEVSRELLAMDQNLAAAHAGLGDSLFRLGRYEEAAAAFRQALGLAPDSPVARRVRSLLAQSLHKLDRLEEAAGEYLRLTELEPDNPEALSQLARVRGQQGRHDEANEYLRRARGLAPDHVGVLQAAAEALRKQERYEEAVEDYRRIMELDPEFGSAYAGTASALFELGRYEAAIEAMERSIVLEPEPSVLPAREVLIGRALAELGRPEKEVAERFVRALETDPRYGDALDRLGLLRFGQERYREALELYERKLETDPQDSQTHSNIGASLYFLDRREAALTSFERAVALDPANEVAQQNLQEIRRIQARDPGRDDR